MVNVGQHGVVPRLDGGRAAFERDALPLVESLYPAALALTRRADDAQDLLQETLLRAWRNFHTFEPGTQLRAWLNRIMLNEYVSRYRRARHAPVAMPPEDMAETAAGDDLDALMREKNAWLELGDRMALREFTEQLDDKVKLALESLGNDAREVLILNVINGLSYKEIAEALELPVGTVMSRLSRAKTTMRDRLLESGFEGAS